MEATGMDQDNSVHNGDAAEHRHGEGGCKSGDGKCRNCCGRRREQEAAAAPSAPAPAAATRATLALLCALFAAPALLAADVELSVTVRDPGGLPAPAAEVTVEPLAAAAVIRGATGADGRWSRAVAPGEYTVRIRHDGMMGAAASVKVTPDAGRVEREFILQVAPLATQVQVTASRLPESLMEIATPVRQLDRGQMEKLGARQLNDALQEQPEVVTFAGGSHANGGSTNLQGFTSRNVEILVDGQPLSGRVSGYIDLNQFDCSILEAVDIKTGASALTYGLQGLGGAINLITRRAGTGLNASLETGYGSFNTGLLRGDAGFSAGGWSALVAGATQRSLGYDLDSGTAVKTQNANRTTNLFGSLYAPQWKNISSGATWLWSEQEYWGFDVSTANALYDFDRPKKRMLFAPRATVMLDAANLLNLRGRHLFYRSGEDLVYRSPFSASATATTQAANGAEAEWSMTRASGLRSVVGLYFNRQDIRGSSLGTADGDAERDSWSQVASVEYPFRGAFKLQGGYRFDHDSAFGDKWSPQVSAAWRIRSGLSASAALTRGFRAPDFTELYLNNTHAGGRVRVLGNESLRPEQSWSASAGLLYVPRSGVRLEGQLFEHRLEDMILSRLIGREGLASIYRYMNTGAAKIRGGMITAQMVLRRRLELAASYQLLHARDLSTALPLEYSPRHRASLRATWSSRRAGLLASVFGNLTGRTYYGLVNNTPDYMQSFELFGANVQKDVSRNVALRVTFRNLTDNVAPLYRVTAPFSIEGAVRIRLNSAN
jgi:outer membrane receptor for ferrienterochelin and colicins